jgi:hypothetical protein
MSETILMEIKLDKYGKADFGIYGTFGALTLEQLNDVRAMIPVAIFVAEDSWRNAHPDTNVAMEAK